jgi:hypothetical protein
VESPPAATETIGCSFLSANLFASFRASFFRFLCTSNMANEELCLAALTQKIQLSTLGLLHLAQVVGNSRGCGSFAQSNEGCSLVCLQLSPSATWGRPALANRMAIASTGLNATGERFQILRAQHDKNHSSSSDGIRKSGHQNPECSRLAPFTSHDKNQTTERARESDYLGNRSWNCACN